MFDQRWVLMCGRAAALGIILSLCASVLSRSAAVGSQTEDEDLAVGLVPVVFELAVDFDRFLGSLETPTEAFASRFSFYYPWPYPSRVLYVSEAASVHVLALDNMYRFIDSYNWCLEHRYQDACPFLAQDAMNASETQAVIEWPLQVPAEFTYPMLLYECTYGRTICATLIPQGALQQQQSEYAKLAGECYYLLETDYAAPLQALAVPSSEEGRSITILQRSNPEPYSHYGVNNAYFSHCIVHSGSVQDALLPAIRESLKCGPTYPATSWHPYNELEQPFLVYATVEARESRSYKVASFQADPQVTPVDSADILQEIQSWSSAGMMLMTVKNGTALVLVYRPS